MSPFDVVIKIREERAAKNRKFLVLYGFYYLLVVGEKVDVWCKCVRIPAEDEGGI